MSESHDYQEAPWAKGHDYTSARDRYAKHASGSMGQAERDRVTAKSLIEPRLVTKARRPLIVFVDETASMGDWPATIFGKLPYLDHEARDYLGDDCKIAFGAIGDSRNGEKYPLQVRPFGSGEELQRSLLELKHEELGGGNGGETYELAAFYLNHNLDIEELAEPIVIFIGDEPFFTEVRVEDALRYCGVKLRRNDPTDRVFADLTSRASVYLVQKPYGESAGKDEMDPLTRRTYACWSEVLGHDHVVILPDPERVVDVIFGILAKEVGRFDDFREEIEERQRPDQVDTVYKSLETISGTRLRRLADIANSESVMIGDLDKGAPSTPLI